MIYLCTVKWFKVLLCITNNSIKHQSFLYLLGEFYLSVEMQLGYILQPQPTGLWVWRVLHLHNPVFYKKIFCSKTINTSFIIIIFFSLSYISCLVVHMLLFKFLKFSQCFLITSYNVCFFTFFDWLIHYCNEKKKGIGTPSRQLRCSH